MNNFRALSAAARRSPALLDGISASEALRAYSGKLSKGIVAVIRRRQLNPYPAPPAADSKAMLLKMSGFHALTAGDSFLHAKPHDWAKFSEPQITRGWAHFLETRHRLARCQAFLTASFQIHPLSAQIAPCTAIELVEPERGRIDLLLIARTTSNQRVAVCIEAKFEHVLTGDQLRKYELELNKVHELSDPAHRSLLILASRHRRDIARQLRVQENEWQFLTWSNWLIHYDNALPDAADDDEFRRFRRTTLARANKETDWP